MSKKEYDMIIAEIRKARMVGIISHTDMVRRLARTANKYARAVLEASRTIKYSNKRNSLTKICFPAIIE